jgi:hypothetical protein
VDIIKTESADQAAADYERTNKRATSAPVQVFGKKQT